jgi:geranylgeranyl pyrophosphate synthase
VDVATKLIDADHELPPAAPPKSSAGWKAVPESRRLRDAIRAKAAEMSPRLDRSLPLSRERGRELAGELLADLGLGEQYLGFALVMIANEFWREQVAAVPFDRRLFLMPHCLKNAEGCPAEYDELGLNCETCGKCSVADFKTRSEQLGYKVLVSEGTPIVLKIIVSGHVDALVGVACLNVLEKAFDKILLAGIPCVATPLLSSNCKSTSVDQDWVFDSIDLRTAPVAAPTKSYVHLMRAANGLFEADELGRLAPQARKNVADPRDPLARHERIAYDFLSAGGKRSRPFITLATYDALKGGAGTLSAGGIELPDPVKRAALGIEAFHKASLVHDDIQDDDPFRYGQETLHKRIGVPTAINVGDYLIGLGYRLVSRERGVLGAEVAADILDRLADAHVKLSEGQGAELLWRDAEAKELTALDALKIYALKTSPAFEAALYAGVRLAGPAEAYEKFIPEFSRNLGVAFQILNDLNDWSGDDHNKLAAGRDALSARPTLLFALALEGLPPAERAALLGVVQRQRSAATDLDPEATLARIRRWFFQAKAFLKAGKLVEKYKARCETLADELDPPPLRELMYYLIDSVIEAPNVPQEPKPVTTFVGLGMPASAR